MKVVAVAVAGGLALAACGEAPQETPGNQSSAGTYQACMVTDIGGIDDRSFNTSAFKGLTNAAAESDLFAEPVNTSSESEADYEPNLTQYAQGDCDFILAVGGLMGDATNKVAAQFPDKQFAIVDFKATPNNVFSMQFDTAQAAFLAGYLAAGYSKTGKVATYGGLNIDPVTIFMDGFVDGVAYYNEQKGTNVEVLGWDKASRSGTFAESFIDQARGKAISDAFVAQGADVIMPVAGGTGLGTAAAAQASNGQYVVIWVDIDGCESAQQYCNVFLSTVVKNIPDLVKEAALKASTTNGLLTGGTIGTLANNGVSLAPYHEFDDDIPAELKSEIEQLKQDIISGKVKVESPAQPK
ncbi:MAG: BMP family ABC transporter substrate-binding protein [Micromonosporaceae bacterium]|nr:BMP family ABC transporter substrate-binding protein [Micromonosporaceae bacterium]